MFEETGVYGHLFFDGGPEPCANVHSLVTPSAPPVYIRGFGHAWSSPFDHDATIFPGLKRYVLEEKTGTAVGAIEYRSPGEYRISAGGAGLSVHIERGSILFRDFSGDVAEVRRTENRAVRSLGHGYEAEKRFDIVLRRPVSDELKLLILAFPMLEFFKA